MARRGATPTGSPSDELYSKYLLTYTITRQGQCWPSHGNFRIATTKKRDQNNNIAKNKFCNYMKIIAFTRIHSSLKILR